MYARYIPTTSGAPADSSWQAYATYNAEPTTATRDVADEPIHEPAKEAVAPAPPPESSEPVESTPKPKKEPKREKKKRKREDAEPEDDGSDEIKKRHKAVFEKVQRSLLQAQSVAKSDDVPAENEDTPQEPEEHGLEPLPQPAPVVFDESKLAYETLPPWLASPIRVTADTRQPFSELKIASESAKILASKGFQDAFAVQTAVLPLLLPTGDRQGDVVVAAPTGSGKTLSYVLPMVQDVSKSVCTRLRAVIVLPTRDLVHQVQQTCEACAAAFAIGDNRRVKIGTAMGNKAFKEEQRAIMDQKLKHDPEGYDKWLDKQRRWPLLEYGESGDEEEFAVDAPQPLPYHVFEQVSKVDVLICTPGRLVEHITKTRGFSLDYVRWLIVDEADKLLAQDFQQWLDVVMEKLSVSKPGYRNFPDTNKTGVRKVVLSATMTRDISLLNGLKLSRPKLVVLEGTKAGEQSLPATLEEAAIKIRDPSLKPLYLVDLLNSEHLSTPINQDTTPVNGETEASANSDASSLVDSDSDSDSNSDVSDSDSNSDSDSDSAVSSSDSEKNRISNSKSKTRHTSRPSAFPTTVLIFTKSNEAALRLSRLLALLMPHLASLIGTLTSSTKTLHRTQTLRAFSQGKLRILVASDLVSRGIDLLNLDHVINYDIPISETSYVHRVGRTARAGRKGCAWTLLEHAEARRFWREFAGEGKKAVTTIVRTGDSKVKRVALWEGKKGEEFGEERLKKYEDALEVLRKEALGGPV